MAKLNPNQDKFAREYVKTGNASEAYRRAYPKSLKWKEKTVHETASRLKADDKVATRIAELQDEIKKKFDISAERLLLEQSRLALFDFRRLFDENGRLVDVTKIPDDVAAAVSSVKVNRVKKSQEEPDEEVVEIKLWNKNTALDSLFKNAGLYEKDNKQKYDDKTTEELVARAEKLIGALKSKQ